LDGLPVRKFLTAAGDGTGTYNLIGDYSAAPQDFSFLAVNEVNIYTLLIAISDNANFNQGDYGAIVGGLTNGIGFFLNIPGTGEGRLIHPVNLKFNYEWLSITHNVSLTSFAGIAQTLCIGLQVSNDFGMPLQLLPGWRFIVRLNDNFTSLISQTFGIRGIFL